MCGIARGLSILLIVTVVLLAAPGPAHGQAGASAEAPVVAALERDLGHGDSRAAARFWKTVAARGTPLVDTIAGDPRHLLATFLFRGERDTKGVVLVAGPDGIEPFLDPRSYMRNVVGTDVWYTSRRVARDAEFLYYFSVNPPPAGNLPGPGSLRPSIRPDTLNPLQYPEPSDPMYAAGHGSIARMPATPANPWLDRRPDSPHGTVRPDTVASAALDASRAVWTYASPGASLRNANILIVLDGRAYLQRIPTPTILDNLFAAHRIEPTVAVFVDNGAARDRDYGMSDAFNRFLADELVPWVAKRYGVVPRPERTTVAGSSLGGLAAAYAVMRRPDVLGNALSESGAFWPSRPGAEDREPEWLARHVPRLPAAHAFFWLAVGSYEYTVAEETTLLASNRHLRDILRLSGYRCTYVEIPGDHDPIDWRRALPAGLMATLNASHGGAS